MITIIHLLNDIGLGHCRRMQIYASRLVKKEHDVIFLIQKHRNDHFNILEGLGYQIIQYNNQDSIDIQFELISSQTENIDKINWVIDSKLDCSDWILYLKKMSIQVTLFDNQTNARLLVEQNIYPTPLFDKNELDWQEYKGVIRSGWEEVLISESILSLKKNIDKDDRKYILVTFGGADPNEITLIVMNACLNIDKSIPIKVVIGPLFKHSHKIKALNTAMDHRFELIENCDDLASHIASLK